MEQKILLNKNNATLSLFLKTDTTKKNLPFVIVVPGGGYTHFGSKEQDSIALKFNSLGFNSAVLRYTLTPMNFPQPLEDAAQAVEYIRTHAAELNTDSGKIGLCGFSAGGHVSASLGAWWNSELLKTEGFKADSIKPDFLVLCYPVISADKTICHEGSVQELISRLTPDQSDSILKLTKSPDLRNIISVEKHITGDFPKSFIWHTKQDQAVPVQNTIRLVQELEKNGCEFEYHLFNNGPHGLALAENTPAELWPEMFVNWYKTNFNGE